MAIWIGADFDAAEWAAWWPALQAALPGERLLRERTPADAALIDIALVANPPLGSLRDLPALRLVQSLWAGVDRLLADPDLPVDVPLARMVDPAMAEAMAQTGCGPCSACTATSSTTPRSSARASGNRIRNAAPPKCASPCSASAPWAGPARTGSLRWATT